MALLSTPEGQLNDVIERPCGSSTLLGKAFAAAESPFMATTSAFRLAIVFPPSHSRISRDTSRPGALGTYYTSSKAHTVPDRSAAWNLSFLRRLYSSEGREEAVPPATEHDKDTGQVVKGLENQCRRAVQLLL
jgi:hypothetical protein